MNATDAAMWVYFALNTGVLVYSVVAWLDLRKTVQRWFAEHGHAAANLNLRVKLVEQDIDKIRDWAKAQRAQR